MRATFPEYIQWQNAMRPEDIGYHDGRASLTSGHEAQAQYATKVARHLASLLGVVRNNFASEEHAMWAEYSKSKARLERVRSAVFVRANGASTPAGAPLNRAAAIGIVVVLALCAAGLLALVLQLRGLDTGSAAAFAAPVGVALAALSYVIGVLLRQATHVWVRRLSLVFAAAAVMILVAAVVSMPTAAMSAAERLLVASAIVLCCLAIGAVAFYSHVPDPEATRLERELTALHARLADLVAARNENREFHLNVALRHRELAGQMIAVYRQAYSQCTPAGATGPESFQLPPELAEIDSAWFQIHEENAL